MFRFVTFRCDDFQCIHNLYNVAICIEVENVQNKNMVRISLYAKIKHTVGLAEAIPGL